MVQESFGTVDVDDEKIEERYDLFGESFYQESTRLRDLRDLGIFPESNSNSEQEPLPGMAELAFDVHQAIDNRDYDLKATPARFFASTVYGELQEQAGRERYLDAEDVLEAVETLESERKQELRDRRRDSAYGLGGR